MAGPWSPDRVHTALRACVLVSCLGSISCGGVQQTRPTVIPPTMAAAVVPLVGPENPGPVIHKETVETEGHRYVGGTVQVWIRAPADFVVGILRQPQSYWHVLPMVWDVTPVGDVDGEKLVELEQGTKLVRGRYTVRVKLREDGCKLCKAFDVRLDPARPHDLRDAWGVFRVRPADRGSLLVYVIRVDLGPGLVRMLFEEQVREAALKTPSMVRAYAEGAWERLLAERQ